LGGFQSDWVPQLEFGTPFRRYPPFLGKESMTSFTKLQAGMDFYRATMKNLGFGLLNIFPEPEDFEDFLDSFTYPSEIVSLMMYQYGKALAEKHGRD